MKRAFMSELAIVRTLIPSIAGVGLFIFVVLTLANASDGDSGMSAGACAASAMSPIMVMNSLAGFDNQNGWERYRATLPFSRKDIICARYLSVIVFSAVMACAATLLSIVAIPLFNGTGIPSTGQTVFEIAIASAASMLISLMMVFLAQPLFFRFGHMEALRLSVGLFALLGCLAIATLSSSNPISNWLMSIAGANPDPAVLGCLCAGIAVLALVAMCSQLHRQHQGLSSTRSVATRASIHEGRDRRPSPQIRDKWHVPGARHHATCAAVWAAECRRR